MSSGEDVEVSYYSSVLAKAIKQEDGDAFTELYDEIITRVTEDKVNSYSVY